MKFPSSKSYSQRAMICALLASNNGTSTLKGIDFSGDERSALQAIKTLGAKCEITPTAEVLVSGGEVLKNASGIVNVGESGFLARTIPFVGALSDQGITLHGEETLRNRPLDAVKTMLGKMGKNCTGDKVPLIIQGGGIEGGNITFDGSKGSQTLSGILLAAPYAKNNLKITIENLTSKSYVDMTLETMSAFGAQYTRNGYEYIEIHTGNGGYKPTEYMVEGDWSAASYFLVASRIWSKSIELENLNMESKQADRAILEVMELSRGGTAIEFDATHCPDLFTAIVPLCATLCGTSKIKGLSRLSTKESDRGVVLKREFEKFGVGITLHGDIMEIEGRGSVEFTQSAAIDPAGDHRIAMATAIMAREVAVMHPEVVDKSFSDFFLKREEFFAL